MESKELKELKKRAQKNYKKLQESCKGLGELFWQKILDDKKNVSRCLFDNTEEKTPDSNT